MKLKFKDIILKETEDYIFVNKPPGISTLADRSDPSHLLDEARKYLPDLQVCHRLDKETSGVLLFSKNKEAYRYAAIQFEDRRVKKKYHALVDGRVSWKGMEVEEAIKVSNKGVGLDSQGKEAITNFNTLEVFNHHSLVECLPITGRMHQIRLHLTHLGHPIVGDANYGGKPFFLSSIKRNYNLKKWTEEQPIMKRVALHAVKLGLVDVHGNFIDAEAPYPKDFAVSLKQLRKYV